MSYETFPTTIRNPSRMRPMDVASTVRVEFEGGYKETRARHTRILKVFELEWDHLPADEYLAFLEFWRARNGASEAFYWQFPLEMYGEPGWGGHDTDPPDSGSGTGFESEVDVGWGEGPKFLVRFLEDELHQEYSTEYDRWTVRVRLETV